MGWCYQGIFEIADQDRLINRLETDNKQGKPIIFPDFRREI